MIISRRNALILSAAAVTGLQASQAQAAIKTRWVDYQQGDTALRGYLAYDESVTTKRPGVLLAHRRDGMSDLTLQNAEMVAKQGYVVFALDIFGKDHQPKDVPQQIEASGSFNKNRPLMRARTQAGFDVLMEDQRARSRADQTGGSPSRVSAASMTSTPSASRPSRASA